MALGSFSSIATFVESELEPIEKVIGNGGIGVVGLYQARRKRPLLGIRCGDRLAVKRLGMASNAETLRKEAEILWRLHENCKYIIRLMGVMQHNSEFSLVLQYMKHGNISQFFSTVLFNNLNLWPLKIRIAKQICEGMAFLHSHSPRPILHRDLKAANVLLDDELDVKICDFGLARIKSLTTRPSTNSMCSEGKQRPSPAGTVSHIAPEVLGGKSAGTKADVFSFAILLWELMTDRVPYEGLHPAVVICRVEYKGMRPTDTLIPNDKPETLAMMMRNSWKQNPDDRPAFQELLGGFPTIEKKYSDDMQTCVTEALEAWVAGNNTPVKKLRTTDFQATTDNNMTHSNHRANSEPGDRNRFSYEFPTAHCSTSSQVRRHTPEIPNNMASEEMRISSMYHESQRKLDEVAPLIAPPHLNSSAECTETGSRGPIIRNKKSCQYTRVLITVLMPLLLCAMAFIVYLSVQLRTGKGCCVECFNSSETSLTTKCVPKLHKVAPPDSKCSFSCADGFVLNGSQPNLICNQSGKWSGPLPYCRKIRQCQVLPQPANGGTVQCTNKNYEESTCEFSCPVGYRIRIPGLSSGVGIRDSLKVTCQSDTYLNYRWSKPVPYCEKVANCGKPRVGDTVQVLCKQSDSLESVKRGFSALYRVEKAFTFTKQEQNYTNGTECQFSCPTTTSLSTDDNSALCKVDGTWNITEMPQCINGCPSYTVPGNGNVACTLGRKYNSRCIFQCDQYFIMLGSINMVCQMNGKWSTSAPTCVCPSCRSGSKCEHTLLFKDVVADINDTTHGGKITYDGYEISCGPNALGCQCRDKKTNFMHQCNKPTYYESCEYALASVILMMTANGTYTLPCDAEIMPAPC